MNKKKALWTLALTYFYMCLDGLATVNVLIHCLNCCVAFEGPGMHVSTFLGGFSLPSVQVRDAIIHTTVALLVCV